MIGEQGGEATGYRRTADVLRPIPLAHWTRTAAANDADELFALLQTRRKERG